ncbi:class I SAM-dependent methyltransferase [Nesterenkonia haasae]|uniref:hypothetical protein n=1 Tax=Nesterenkonia haasae TaxID=2587813 RepID=UPI001391BF2C|nr:hypothetical protein [Nesterenkonia haasae]NDK33150.1 hypothetical protein [Nesterenkonia haasae]
MVPRFDLIWASDVIWPTVFEDPGGVVVALAQALAPGGVLALFNTNYCRSMSLPGHSRLERMIRTASEHTWGLIQQDTAHYERHGEWLQAAGMKNISVDCFPIAATTLSPGSAARAYLEGIVWPEMRHAASASGVATGMKEEDLRQVEVLLDPGSSLHVGLTPTTYTVHPTLLWTGARLNS